MTCGAKHQHIWFTMPGLTIETLAQACHDLEAQGYEIAAVVGPTNCTVDAKAEFAILYKLDKDPLGRPLAARFDKALS